MASSLHPNEIEAANRAEATAILIRAGYRVYRPEADVFGEDLVLRSPKGELRAVQMKSRPSMDWPRYGKKEIWMLFPDPDDPRLGRAWFFIKHDDLFYWAAERHGIDAIRDGKRHYPSMSADLRKFLQPFMLRVAESHMAAAAGTSVQPDGEPLVGN